jgi:hypothetical protein
MPLKAGTSDKVFSQNVSELIHRGKKKRKTNQILAIAYAMKRKSGKK